MIRLFYRPSGAEHLGGGPPAQAGVANPLAGRRFILMRDSYGDALALMRVFARLFAIR